jgi:hypothetical protein
MAHSLLTITAQDLYDTREAFGAISGTDLHALFGAVCGERAPIGRTPIDTAALLGYASSQRELYAAHKANGGVGGEYLLDAAAFAESFTR